jgi:N-methylhydantoinase A
MLLGVDVGGTYTDAVLVVEGSAVHTAKVLSTPAEQSLGVLAAIMEVLARAGAAPGEVERFAHGMTVATNALLQGRSARTALVASAGFTDVIELGRQDRPHLYRLDLAAPEPLVPAGLRFGAPERMGPDGPLRVLEDGPAAELVAEIARSEPEAVAVSLLHSYAHPAHEQLIGELLEQAIPGANICLSTELVGTFREFERTATTVLDAALSPLLASYLLSLGRQARELGLAEPQVMQSSGGLIDASRAGAHAALTVLSGPAGGVAGALLLAELAGEPRVLCFDMGGTSCDVCLIDDYEVAETAERSIAGRPLSLPALDIHTVGAGGGSIAWRDPGGALRVGPTSAGAYPGPACYGRGGSLPTVTDANLLLGRLLGEAPLAGGLTLDRDAAEQAVGGLAGELGLDTMACAAGIVRVAEAEMLGALRLMTVERGIDPRDFALMPFGGAGPLHAAALAEALGISRILCPRASGVLCALGLAAAAPRRDVSRTLLLSGDSLTAERLSQERRRLLAEATHQLGGRTPARVRLRQELRYLGQSFELPVDDGPLDPGALGEAFARAHEQRYGYSDPDGLVELVTMRLSAWGAAPELSLRAAGGEPGPTPGRRPIRIGEEVLDGEILLGEPPPGRRLAGPCLCALPEATLLVPPGWQGEVDPHGTIHLHRGPEAGS